MEIANSDPGKGTFQKDIAIRQDLSLKYLDQIVHALKTANLICNVSGRKSGYILTREPGKITIFDIHRAFEPEICLVECLSKNYNCVRCGQCKARDFWIQLNNLVIGYFKSVTLEDLMTGNVLIDNLSRIDQMSRSTV